MDQEKQNAPERGNEEAVTKPNKIKTFFINTLKGVTLGVSTAIAGLSAGTIAIAERCYDPLVSSISDLRKHFRKNFLFLLPFIIGLLLGAVAALVGIQRGYQIAPFTLTGLFAGFVIGSLPVTIRELHRGKNAKETTFHILALLLSLTLAAGLGLATAFQSDFSLANDLANRVWWMYLFVPICGFIAAFSCVVPGISGSMTLMVLGMYYPILNTYLGADAIWHAQGESSSSILLTGLILALLLVLGAFFGVIVSSKAMRYFLNRHRVTSFYAILGFIVGSLVSMFINYDIFPRYATMKTWDYILGSALFVLCAILSFFLVRYAGKASETK